MPAERRSYAAVVAATTATNRSYAVVAAAAAANTTVLVVANRVLRDRKVKAVDPTQATPAQVEEAIGRPRLREKVTFQAREFVLDDFTDGTCIRYFRFNKAQIRELIMWFQIRWIEFRGGNSPSLELAMCITLYRLSFPNRYTDNASFFGKTASYQSSVFNDVIMFLSNRFEPKLFWDRRLHFWQLEKYAEAVEEASGGLVENVWGFVDGTQRDIARPVKDQREYYSGYKKAHTIKFQAIMAPDGIICHLAGPYPGRLGDWRVWNDSRIADTLRKVHTPFPTEKDRQYVYGDPAYTQSYGVIGAFKATATTALSDAEKATNVQMSRLRISVEHGFGKLLNQWGFLGYGKSLQVGKSPVGAYVQVAVLLANCHMLKGVVQRSARAGECECMHHHSDHVSECGSVPTAPHKPQRCGNARAHKGGRKRGDAFGPVP